MRGGGGGAKLAAGVGIATGGSRALPGVVRGGGICGRSRRSQVRCGPRLFFVVIEVGVRVCGGSSLGSRGGICFGGGGGAIG